MTHDPMTTDAPTQCARPIETAPVNDHWFLVCDPSLSTVAHRTAPWILAHRDDCPTGWMDDDGNDVSPTHYVMLPDPQPAPTGWTPPEGNIVVEKGQWTFASTGEPVPGAAFTISVERSDGSCDDYGWREPDYAPTFEAAMAKATRLQGRTGLPIADRTSNILPFPPPSSPEAA